LASLLVVLCSLLVVYRPPVVITLTEDIVITPDGVTTGASDIIRSPPMIVGPSPVIVCNPPDIVGPASLVIRLTYLRATFGQARHFRQRLVSTSVGLAAFLAHPI
jgi:hypothetical protein